jgi:hypothetical protein
MSHQDLEQFLNFDKQIQTEDLSLEHGKKVASVQVGAQGWSNFGVQVSVGGCSECHRKASQVKKLQKEIFELKNSMRDIQAKCQVLEEDLQQAENREFEHSVGSIYEDNLLPIQNNIPLNKPKKRLSAFFLMNAALSSEQTISRHISLNTLEAEADQSESGTGIEEAIENCLSKFVADFKDLKHNLNPGEKEWDNLIKDEKKIEKLLEGFKNKRKKAKKNVNKEKKTKNFKSRKSIIKIKSYKIPGSRKHIKTENLSKKRFNEMVKLANSLYNEFFEIVNKTGTINEQYQPYLVRDVTLWKNISSIYRSFASDLANGAKTQLSLMIYCFKLFRDKNSHKKTLIKKFHMVKKLLRNFFSYFFRFIIIGMIRQLACLAGFWGLEGISIISVSKFTSN